jgi:DNA-binding PucR family transcriptional regulator
MDSTIAVSAARAAVEALLPRPHLVADLEGEILAAVGVDSADEDEIRLVATRLAQGLERRSSAGGGGRVVALAAGPAVQTLAGLGQSLTAVSEARGLTSRLNLQPAVLLSTEIAVYRLLTRFSSDPELERFVSEQIGGLLDHDSKHNTQLLPTLQALAESGWSKSRAARVLGVQRQTIYRRMDHIQDMIAGSIDDAECRAQLSLALKARRVRAVGSVAR